MAASPRSNSSPPVLVITQGDPAGVGPEILVRFLRKHQDDPRFRPVPIVERSALASLEPVLGDIDLNFASRGRLEDHLQEDTGVVALDPTGDRRAIQFGVSTPSDAGGALAAIDQGLEIVQAGLADALITLPVSKTSIASSVRPGFYGHTEYLAERCGLTEYGKDYLMAFLAPQLKVALLSTHLPLRDALDRVTPERILEALQCIHRHDPGRIVVAGFNPHAGEGGLLGQEDWELVLPGVDLARQLGIPVRGPESADSLFGRALDGHCDWVLSLYHDQGLIAVKTAARGQGTNWTLGLPILRTSVDHGTAFDIAGRGIADFHPLQAVIQTTLGLIEDQRQRQRDSTESGAVPILV